MNQHLDIDASAAVRDWNAPISVSDLNVLARQLIEQSIPLLWVAGEISNLTRAASGHLYFSLKDARAQARCVMFRHRMRYLDWSPANGMQVEVRARPTLYEARGEFQLGVEFIRRAGLGALYEAFARLKTKLEAEGLFAAERKAPLPPFARRIGVVTSPAAAALLDVLTTLRRRMPAVPIIVYPAPVQGEGAAEKLAAAIEAASVRRECDVLILCRGGGSIEDLWAFNEERVARAISACSLPLVCGVGHETDITIADFVADARAPTPTAAAEMVSPNRVDLAARVDASRARLSRALMRRLERRMQQVDYLTRRLAHPGDRIRSQQQHLGHLRARLGRSVFHALRQAELRVTAAWHRLAAAAPDVAALQARCAHQGSQLLGAMQQAQERRGLLLTSVAAHLSALSPQRVLERGYAMVAHADGAIVRAGTDLALGEEVTLTFARGGAQARISGTRT